MTEVTKYNFEKLLPKIKEDIRLCSFVAFDTEFTALTVGSSNKGRYVLFSFILS